MTLKDASRSSELMTMEDFKRFKGWMEDFDEARLAMGADSMLMSMGFLMAKAYVLIKTVEETPGMLDLLNHDND